MDNLAHTLCGAALAKTRLGGCSRLASWSLLIGANLPDADAISRFFGGKAAYLVHHRGITHSVVGVVALALLLATAIRALERRVWPQDARPWRDFLLPAFAGLASHPLLDLLNNYGVRPWLPFSSTRYYGDLVFIVDPALWLLFGAIAALAGKRTIAGSFALAAIGAFATWLVFTNQRSPASVRIYWPAGLAAIALARTFGFGRERPKPVLVGGALAGLLYLGGLELAARTAVARSESATPVEGRPSPLRFEMRSPVVGDPLSWWIWRSSPDRYYLELAHAFRAPIPQRVIERRLDDPRVIDVTHRPAAEAWRYFARLPYALIADDPTGRCLITLADARYHFAQGPTWASIEIEF